MKKWPPQRVAVGLAEVFDFDFGARVRLGFVENINAAKEPELLTPITGAMIG